MFEIGAKNELIVMPEHPADPDVMVLRAVAHRVAQDGDPTLARRMQAADQAAVNLTFELGGVEPDSDGSMLVNLSDDDIVNALRNIARNENGLGVTYTFPEEEAKVAYEAMKKIGDPDNISEIQARADRLLLDGQIGRAQINVMALETAMHAQGFAQQLAPHYEA